LVASSFPTALTLKKQDIPFFLPPNLILVLRFFKQKKTANANLDSIFLARALFLVVIIAGVFPPFFNGVLRFYRLS